MTDRKVVTDGAGHVMIDAQNGWEALPQLPNGAMAMQVTMDMDYYYAVDENGIIWNGGPYKDYYN